MMGFDGYLTTTDLMELTKAAVDGDVVDGIERPVLMQGIPRNFVLGMKRVASPLGQFDLDLVNLNSVERLENGTVPLAQFLRNASFQLKLRSRNEAGVFEKFANRVGNGALGVPMLPDPRQLPEVKSNEAIVGRDDMVDFSFMAKGAETGRSVARILVPRFENNTPVATENGGPWIMVGTAWLISPTLAITNHHVVRARRAEETDPSETDFIRQISDTVTEFDYDIAGESPRQMKAKSVEVFSRALDYAILRLSVDPGRPVLKLYPGLLEVNATTYMAVNIIQHPRGLPKRVAIRNNLVSGADNEVIRYFTDTDFGSSGSPVCDDMWRVVALHRGAAFVKDVNYQGRATAYVNYGSQIQAILADVKRANAPLHEELMHAQ
jgi:endonuclease G